MSIRIETQRLVLREFEKDDVDRLHEICNQQYILKWMPDWDHPIEQRKKWLSWVKEQYPLATKQSARIMLAVSLQETDDIIGMVGIGNKEEVTTRLRLHTSYRKSTAVRVI